MSENKLFVGDVGVAITVTINNLVIDNGEETSTVQDISDYTELKIRAMHCSGRSFFYEDMELLTDGTDGKCRFITTDLVNFDIPGDWRIQVYYESLSGKWSTTTFQIKVYDIVRLPQA